MDKTTETQELYSFTFLKNSDKIELVRFKKEIHYEEEKKCLRNYLN